MLGRRPVLVRKWDESFDFRRDISRVVPVWVLLLHLPTKFWGVESLSSIDSLLGIPIAADDCTSKQSRVNYVPILVEVDVSKPLPMVLMVEDEDGKVYEQDFFIEWISFFCQKCQSSGTCLWC